MNSIVTGERQVKTNECTDTMRMLSLQLFVPFSSMPMKTRSETTGIKSYAMHTEWCIAFILSFQMIDVNRIQRWKKSIPFGYNVLPNILTELHRIRWISVKNCFLGYKSFSEYIWWTKTEGMCIAEIQIEQTQWQPIFVRTPHMILWTLWVVALALNAQLIMSICICGNGLYVHSTTYTYIPLFPYRYYTSYTSANPPSRKPSLPELMIFRVNSVFVRDVRVRVCDSIRSFNCIVSLSTRTRSHPTFDT